MIKGSKINNQCVMLAEMFRKKKINPESERKERECFS